MATADRGGFFAGFTSRRVLIVAAIFIVGYFGLSIVSNAITHARLDRREATVRAQIATLERREARLQALKQYMQSDAFVEAAARESGLVKPGETQVVAIGPGGDAGPDALQPGDPWWYRHLHPDDRR